MRARSPASSSFRSARRGMPRPDAVEDEPGRRLVARPAHVLSAGEIVRAAVAADAARLLANDPGARRGDDVEGVHQARVATRRLRSNLRTFAPLLRRGSTDDLADELRWLGRRFGTVRDLDVLRQRFTKAVR